MGLKFYNECGRMIEPGDASKGDKAYKIRVPVPDSKTPNTVYFGTLTAARKWARKNPSQDKPLLDLLRNLGGG